MDSKQLAELLRTNDQIIRLGSGKESSLPNASPVGASSRSAVMRSSPGLSNNRYETSAIHRPSSSCSRCNVSVVGDMILLDHPVGHWDSGPPIRSGSVASRSRKAESVS